MRFDEVEIGDFFVEIYPGGVVGIYQKKSLTTAFRFSVVRGALIHNSTLVREPMVAKFAKSTKVLLVK